jgi:hypothetical protein
LRPESDAPDVFQSLKWFNRKGPSGLFNASLEGNAERAIDLHEG